MAETCYQFNDTLVLTSTASWDIEGVIHVEDQGQSFDTDIVSVDVIGHTEVYEDYVLQMVFLVGGHEEDSVVYLDGEWAGMPAPQLCVTGGSDANDPGFLAFMQANSTGGGGGGGDDEGINVCADPRYAMIVPIPDGSLVAGEGDTTFGQAYSAFQNGDGVFITYEGDNGTVTCPVTGITEEEGTYTITYIDGGMNMTMTVSGSESETITITAPAQYNITVGDGLKAYSAMSVSSSEITSAFSGSTVYIWCDHFVELDCSQTYVPPTEEGTDGWWSSFEMPAEDVTVLINDK